MNVRSIPHRPDVISAFRGCLVAHAAAIHVGAKHDFNLARNWAWPPELYYTHMIVRQYIDDKGQLNLPAMEKRLHIGLGVEKGEKPPLDQLFGGELEFRKLADMGRKNPIKKLRFRDPEEDWIGGPGFAAHANAIGLVNRNDVGRIVSDSRKIGRITHPYDVAVSAGTVTALAIALAVTEGAQPETIIARLMSTIGSLKSPYQVPDILMRKLFLVEGLLKSGVDTVHGLSELRSKPRRTAVDVVPGALFAALNGTRSLGSLLGPLEIFGNHKSGAIAASIWGAMHGVEAVSEHYLHGLEDIESIKRNAEELY